MADMARFNIPPTPDNYYVWYSYCSGENIPLSRAIDIIISNAGEFDETRCREVFHQFFTPDPDAIAVCDTARAVQREVQRVLDFVSDISTVSNNYDATLKEVSGTLLRDLSVGEIRRMLDGLIAQTEDIQTSNERLRQELHESAEEISALRKNLTSARIESMTDSLTGLSNRKFFDRSLRQAAMDSMETGADLSVIICDVDNFKRFNDKWGHLLGDQVLRLIGSVLQKNVSDIDTAARFGGEEFVVLLQNTALREAVTLAEKIRADISSRKARKRDTGETIGRITCSFGVAILQRGEPLSAFMERADMALYEAKKQGRNRVMDERALPQETVEKRSKVA
jgi:diguanylate cyclase